MTRKITHRGSFHSAAPRRRPSPDNLPLSQRLGRRRFLFGVGGVALGLPFLESFAPRKAAAAGMGPARFAVFV
ncbi:MAG TPA: hypothetical protein VM869_02240, partial [Enhygromyxa sp.]|nr:hypothetical protein [Enhygromyxa sp.]